MQEIKELLKKKLSYEDIQKQLIKSGELMNREVSATSSEFKFGTKLIDAGIKVIPQFKIGEYQYDLKIEQFPVIIEVDGEIHDSEEVKAKDYIKWRYAIKRGFILVRFTNSESHSKYAVEEVKRIIANCTKSPREIWLYPRTIIDVIKDMFKNIFKKRGIKHT